MRHVHMHVHVRMHMHMHMHMHVRIRRACGERAAYMPRAKSCSGSARCSAAAVSHLWTGEAQDPALRA